MSGLTPAERLREAARVLREDPLTVRPGLEPAVAAWLNMTATDMAIAGNWSPLHPAHAVADAVLGEP